MAGRPHRKNPSSRCAEVRATRGKWVERGATAPLGTLVGTRITAAGKIDLLAGGNLDLLPAENTRQIEDRHQRWSLIDSSSLLPQLDHKVKDTTAETTRTPTGAHLDGQRVTLAANGNAHIVTHAAGRDTLTAMDAARNAATNNRLATQQEKDRIRQLAGGDSEKERRLTAASCALIRCSAQFAEGSEAWRIGRALEIEGARPEYAADRALLQGQAGMFGYTTTGLFSDKNIDAAKRVDDTYKISTRAGGALQAIGGVATGVAGVGMVAAGGATCLETGVGCVVAAGGTALTGWSADQTRAGWNTLSTGQHQQTLGGAWVSSTFGVSPNTGELIYGLAGLSPAAVEAVGLNRVANGYAAGNAASRASYGAKGAAAVDEANVVANSEAAALDWSRISVRTGGDAAEHVTLNHGTLSLTKPNQGVFYGDPVASVEDAWAIAQQNGLKPVTVGNRDIYVVPRANSGYAGGMSGQLENYNHVTIITEAGTPRVVTGYPSGGTPPMPKGYNFLLGN